MPLAATSDLIDRAASSGTAVAAVNVITLEHIEAVVSGAEAASRPVILQISEGTVKYRLGRLAPLAAAAVAVARAARVEVALHLDHVRNLDLLPAAADCGISSVMIDAAHLPYDQNVAATRRAADWAHAHGIWAEAELGEVSGKDGQGPPDAHAPGARTDPAQAARYIEDTEIDALAVAVVSTHAMTPGTGTIDRDLLGRLRDSVRVPLVLHGSSGLPDSELLAAAAGGITKINFGTALNIAMTQAICTRLSNEPPGGDPRGYLSDARTAMTVATTRLLSAIAAPVDTLWSVTP
ncbi:fructose-bisphosphate aldolase [Kitasatospora herbaricolor]|uniref:class II fructose-bisphosphate aldolase n=1 Tax=Kitasatospora herbaricolor TaxID=68217 RepID=UPI00174E8ED0|nr:class II fructose-bisphosphate aldolase [Kitasatospora herbaricolor]MDQ0312616.1 fructose-bisphosphate aldolase class II [Kitasatospora herbaricolor]GGV38787.1 fructose-bisphosphate aldolase [Kitasatospora herbaricolor]